MEENGLYIFFASLGAGWVNAATVISAIFGIGFSFFAFFYSKKSSDKSAQLIEEIRRTATATHQNADLANKNARILRLDNLRILYDLSEGKENHLYWRYRWRFEMFDCLRLMIYMGKGDSKVLLGFCEILILGFSIPSDSAGFERKGTEFYKAKIRDITVQNEAKFPFEVDDAVSCFCGNDDLFISKGVDH